MLSTTNSLVHFDIHYWRCASLPPGLLARPHNGVNSEINNVLRVTLLCGPQRSSSKYLCATSFENSVAGPKQTWPAEECKFHEIVLKHQNVTFPRDGLSAAASRRPFRWQQNGIPAALLVVLGIGQCAPPSRQLVARCQRVCARNHTHNGGEHKTRLARSVFFLSLPRAGSSAGSARRSSRNAARSRPRR